MKHAANTGADNGFDWRDTLIWCGVPVAIVLLVRMFLIGFYVIPSGSMMDTIEPGDRVITTKLTPKLFSLRRGDVVVFKDPDHWLQEENSGRLGGDFLIKRLIGLPGDTVACEGPGQPVTVNGVAIDESSYIRSGVDPSSFAFKVKVTPATYSCWATIARIPPIPDIIRMTPRMVWCRSTTWWASAWPPTGR